MNVACLRTFIVHDFIVFLHCMLFAVVNDHPFVCLQSLWHVLLLNCVHSLCSLFGAAYCT